MSRTTTVKKSRVLNCHMKAIWLLILLALVAVAAAQPTITLVGNSVVDGTKLNASQKPGSVLNLTVSPSSQLVYSVNGNAYQVITNGTAGSATLNGALSEGANTVRIVAIESDTQNSTLEITVRVDTLQPSASVSFSPSSTQPAAENVILSWTFSDSNLLSSWISVKAPNGTILTNQTSASSAYAILATNVVAGTYTADYQAVDDFAQVRSGQATLVVSNSLPQVTLESPANKTLTNTRHVAFQCKASDANLTEITLYHNNDQSFSASETKAANSSQTITFNITSLDPEEFIWNCQGRDAHGGTAFASQNRTVIIDTAEPSIGALSPADGFGTLKSDVTFLWVASDNRDGDIDCALWVNGTKKKEQTKQSGNETELTFSLGDGTYEWHVECLDEAQNNRTTATRKFTVDALADEVVPAPAPTPAPEEPKEELPKVEVKEEPKIEPQSQVIVKTQEVTSTPEEIEETPLLARIAKALGGRFSFRKSVWIAVGVVALVILTLGVLGLREYSKDNIMFKVKMKKYKFLARQFWETKIKGKKLYFEPPQR